LNNTKGTFIYDNFLNIYNIIRDSNEIYDLIVMDTVHYKEYVDKLLKIIVLKTKLVVLHDALPYDKNLIQPKRKFPSAWCGETYLSIFNFYINNPNNTFIINDDFVGYAFIKCTNDMNLIFDSKIYTLEHIRTYTKTHEDFYNNYLEKLLLN
jgi:hypothetical protein